MEEMIQALQKLVSFKSVFSDDGDEYPYGRETDAATNYLLDLASKFGFKTCKKNGYVYVEIGEGEKLIGILSHIDVVPAGTGWKYPPFEATVVENKIYGRGTIDDKGPTIAVLYAMRDILFEGVPKSRIRLIIGQSEENGEWVDIDNYIKHEELPSLGFTPDGDFPVIIGEKGCLLLKISMPLAASGMDYAVGGMAPNMVPSDAKISINGEEYLGRGVASHGSAPWNGVNAIDEAFKNAEKYLPDRDIKEPAFIKMYKSLLQEDIYGKKLGINNCDRILGNLTLNVGKIYCTGSAIEIMLDIRYPGNTSSDEIIKKTKACFKSYGADCECIYRTKAISLDCNSSLTKALLDAYQEITKDFRNPIAIGGSTYAKAMDNIIAFGPNFPNHENREHREDEYITIDDFRNLRTIYKRAIENLCNIV